MQKALQVLIMAAALCFAAHAHAQTRHALIIGNADYDRAQDLRNPANDASDIADRLSEVGFEVHSGGALVNLPRGRMLAEVRAFARSLAPGDIALFYFAGHGVQLNGVSYLLPTDDADLQYIEDVDIYAVSADLLLEEFASAAGAHPVIILDACRNSPLPRRDRSADRGVWGLAQVAAPAGSYIAYAAAPGETADDGAGRNGVFTGALLAELEQSDRRVTDIFNAVRARVREATGGRQTPWSNSSLEDALYIAPPLSGIAGSEIAAAFQALENPCDFQAFAEAYPDTAFAPIALRRAVACGPGAVSAAAPAQPQPEAPFLGIDTRDIPPETERLLERCQLGDYGACLIAGRQLDQGAFGVEQRVQDAFAVLDFACDQGHSASCSALGYMLSFGRGQDRNETRAFELFNRACEGGSAYGCANLAAAYMSGIGVEADLDRGFALAQIACDGGSDRGCSNLAGYYYHGFGVAVDVQRAVALWRQTCETSQGRFCDQLGSLYLDDATLDGVGQDYERALEYFQQSCDQLNSEGCARLASMHHYGLGIQQDLETASHLYRRSCLDNRSWACVEYASILAVGTQNQAADPRQAIAIAQEACENGLSQGCRAAGSWFYAGEILDNDLSAALEHYQRACELEDSESCHFAGYMLTAHPGIEADYRAAAELFQAACNLDSFQSCTQLANMALLGQGMSAKPSTAVGYYRRGCEGGHAEACYGLGLLEYEGQGTRQDQQLGLQRIREGCEASIQQACVALNAIENGDD